MLYAVLGPVALIAIIVWRSRSNRALAFTILLVASLAGSLASFMLFLAKDNFYFYIVYRHFGIREGIWNYLLGSPVYQSTIVRAINVFSSLFAYSCLGFSISFASFLRGPAKNRLLAAAAIFPVLQVIIYDPGLYERFYLAAYPDWVSAIFLAAAKAYVHAATQAIGIAYFAASLGILAAVLIRSAKLPEARGSLASVLACELFMIALYCHYLGWAPDFLLDVSKIGGFARYRSVFLSNTSSSYLFYQLYFCASVVFMALFLYSYLRAERRTRSMSAAIERDFDSAVLVSRVFAHFIKNELLCMETDLETIEAAAAPGSRTQAAAARLIERRKAIYARLSDIQGALRRHSLLLVPLPIDRPIRAALETAGDKLEGVEVELELPPEPPLVPLDEPYFVEALVQLLANSAEAMKGERRLIRIVVDETSAWAVVSVSDTGSGIAPEDMKKIFTPFYSTKPSTTNWGLGLSLCHTIISAHGGRIHAMSELGKGTIFRILLPRDKRRKGPWKTGGSRSSSRKT